MDTTYNKNLMDIASKSAFKHSSVPILICDENFYICAKSTNTELLTMRLPPRSCIADQFSDSDLQLIKNCGSGAVRAPFGHRNQRTSVIVTSGKVNGETYFAVIFEPAVVFSKNPLPWFIQEVCSAVSDSVNELLSTPAKSCNILKHQCLRLSRMCDISELINSGYVPNFSKPVIISNLVSDIFNYCKTTISLVGISVILDISDGGSDITYIRTKALEFIAASMLMSTAALSEDRNVVFGCRRNRDSGTTEIFTRTVPRSSASNITSFDKLVKSSVPLRIELAAIIDMSEHFGFTVRCTQDSGNMTLSCILPSEKNYELRMEAPVPLDIGTLADMFAYMYAIIYGDK